MRFDIKDPPRRFPVGDGTHSIADCGSLRLDADEQVTLLTDDGGEYDVARKDWGFYATPSLNGRLLGFGLHGVLIRNRGTGRYFVLLVEQGKEPAFDAYCRRENLAVVCWLDDTAKLDRLAAAMSEPPE